MYPHEVKDILVIRKTFIQDFKKYIKTLWKKSTLNLREMKVYLVSVFFFLFLELINNEL